MRHQLLRSNAFIRAARKMIKKNPYIAENIKNALELLAEDPFHPKLKLTS